VDLPSLWDGSRPVLERIVSEAEARDLPVFLVGGAVRDALRGVPGNDLDLVVEAASPGQVLELASALACRLGGVFVPLDRGRGIARIVLKEGRNLDLAARVGSTLEDDLRHRDFTLNAMAWDLKTGRILDPTGGRSDLEKRILRPAGPNSLVEDPLRTMRALRMLCSLPLRPAPGLPESIQAHAAQLRRVSPERIRDEFFACLQAGLLPHWDLFVESGLLGEVLPQTGGLPGAQGRRARAILASLEAMHLSNYETLTGCPGALRAHLEKPLAANRRPLEILQLAALLDSGSIPAREADWIEGVGKSLVLSRREIRRLTCLLTLYEKPRALARRQGSPGAWYRLFREAGASAPDLLVFTLACDLGAGGQDHVCLEYFRCMLDDFFQEGRVTRPKSPVTGADLALAFGLSPGPLVGRLLERLAEAVADGQVQSRQEALALASEWLARDS
jgi:tRNA nucleotidyltransferase/poly(A) polymerase